MQDLDNDPSDYQVNLENGPGSRAKRVNTNTFEQKITMVHDDPGSGRATRATDNIRHSKVDVTVINESIIDRPIQESENEEESGDEGQNEVEKEALKQESIQIKVVSAKSFATSEVDKIAYRYLFWACSRGNMFTVNHILQEHGISPFMAESDNLMTPFLSAIENNSERVVRLILNKTFVYGPDPKLLERQMLSADKFKNNPLHKACRFRNHKMLKQIVRISSSLIKERNVFGKLPLEMPHNDILNDEKIKAVFATFLNDNSIGEREDNNQLKHYIKLEKEPDYVFVVAKDRLEVLTQQLEAIEEFYQKQKKDGGDSFGIFPEKCQQYLRWRCFSHSADPEQKSLVLVTFSDRILNRKAEEIRMNVHLQNKYQTLPFVLEAQNNFQRFSASQKMILFNKIFASEFDVTVLVQVGVIKDHFMLHSSMKGAVLNSWNGNKWSLMFSMLGIGDTMSHIEPILLIADYYGEKQAMYFTFLIHHIAMLMIPSFFGLFLQGYQIYLST